MQNKELKKNLLRECPFCGGEAKIVEDNNIVKIPQYQIRCKNVACTIRPKTNWCVDKQEAINAWNNRATEAEIRNRAIDEFVARMFEDAKYNPSTFVWWSNIKKIAEQLKEGMRNGKV